MPANDPPLIIFVVGRPRSGTNLVRSILNQHSEIWLSGEPKFFNPGNGKGVISTFSYLFPFDKQDKAEQMFRMLRSGKVKGKYWINPKLNINNIKSEFEGSSLEWRDLIWITLRERARIEGKSLFGEKTPYNLHVIPTLLDWFPGAKFLHIIRDPRAVFVSEINRSPNSHYRFRTTNALSRFFIFIYIIFDWSRNLRFHKMYQRDYPGEYLYVNFRLLIINQEEEIRKICEFTGIDFEEAMLNPPRRGSNFSADYDPVDGWRKKIPFVYKSLFTFLLGRRIRDYC